MRQPENFIEKSRDGDPGPMSIGRLFQNPVSLGFFAGALERAAASSGLQGMFDLTRIFHGLQRRLFPAFTEELGELSVLDQQFCEVIALTQLGRTRLLGAIPRPAQKQARLAQQPFRDVAKCGAAKFDREWPVEYRGGVQFAMNSDIR